jgi:hypothetical protein
MSPPNLQTHLQLVVDELLELWPGEHNSENGDFVRVRLGQNTLDFQGHCKLVNRVQASAARSCVNCAMVRHHVIGSNKITYGGYRHFLSEDHPLRSNPDYGEPCLDGPPPPVDMADLQNEVVSMMACVKESNTWGCRTRGKRRDTAERQADDISDRTGQHYGVVELWRAPGFLMSSDSVLDLIHCIAGILQRLVGMLKGEKAPKLNKRNGDPVYRDACRAIQAEHAAIKLSNASQKRCDAKFLDLIRAFPGDTFARGRRPFTHTGSTPRSNISLTFSDERGGEGGGGRR